MIRSSTDVGPLWCAPCAPAIWPENQSRRSPQEAGVAWPAQIIDFLAMMMKRKLGKGGLEVSALSLGCMG